jgi:sec-independent protein translocase protein TatB
MFDIGFSKIVLIFGLALIVLGPERLPRVAAAIGRWVGRARVMARQFRDQLELESEQLRKSADLSAELNLNPTATAPPPAPAAPPTPAPAEALPAAGSAPPSPHSEPVIKPDERGS